MFLFFGLFEDSTEKNLMKNSHVSFSFERFTTVGWDEHITDFAKMVHPYISERQSTFKIPKTTTWYSGQAEGYITGIGLFLKSIFKPSRDLERLYEEYTKKYRSKNVRFYFRSIVETIIIPNSVKTIYENAFDNSEQYTTNLRNIIIPDSVTEIGNNAFRDIPHIEYHGSASGAPWGAKSMN